MPDLSPEIVRDLRALASAGATVPQLLRDLIRRAPKNQPGSLYQIMYFKEAFHLPLRAATPIGGWDESGSAEITDDRVEELLRPEMQKTMDLWKVTQSSHGC